MTIKSLNSNLLKALMGLGLLLAGCQDKAATPPVAGAAQEVQVIPALEQTPTVDLTTELKASQAWRIAFVPKEKFYARTGNLGAYWQPAWEGAEQAGKDFGVEVKLMALDVFCETDAECVEPQIRLIADLIERGDIDGLVVAPLDSDRLAPVVNKAIAAGIPTLAMDTAVNSDQLLTFVTFDNFAAGQIIGKWVVEQLGGRGKVTILEGPSDQQNAVDRRNGFLAGLQGGDIDVLDTQSGDWEIEPAQEITTAWLQKYADIDVILAANDDMALGAAQAIAEAHRQGIIVTGFDATDAGLAAIEAGQVAATIDQAPGKQARLAIQLLLRHLETGETFPSIIFLPEIPLVTPENVGDYLSEK
jgi:ribose transport system substrate-binding protein